MTKTEPTSLDKFKNEPLERECLSYALNHMDDFLQFLNKIKQDHFSFKEHKIIFNIIESCIHKNEQITPLLIADRLVSLGIQNFKNVGIFDYVNTIASIKRDSNYGMLESMKRLNVLYKMRSVYMKSKALVKKMVTLAEPSTSDINKLVEETFSDLISLEVEDGDPTDIYDGMKELIEEAGNNEGKSFGVLNPYPIFRARYGDFRNGGLYVFRALPKQGKSTILQDIARKVAEKDDTLVLYLDTELTKKEVQFRFASVKTGVNASILETGKFRKNEDMLQRVRKFWKQSDQYKGYIDIQYVAGKTIDQVITTVRKWYYKNKHRNKKMMVIYDYIKLTGERVSEANKEYQVIGAKSSKMKDLAQELQVPFLTAIQSTEAGTAALSSQVKWYCDLMAGFRRKTPNEISFIKDAEQKYGTHILEIDESRNNGIEGVGHFDFIQSPNGNFEKNKINLLIKDFNVEEICDYKQMYEEVFPERMKASTPSKEEGETFYGIEPDDVEVEF